MATQSITRSYQENTMTTNSIMTSPIMVENVTHIGVGIDTARYGHRVTFLRGDRQPAAPAITVTENQEGFQQ